MKFKVCGLKESANMLDVSELEPDYIGLIFWSRSKRYVKGSSPELPNDIKKTGVFVDENLEEIKNKIKEHSLRAIQLHGNESPSFCKNLMSSEIEVIKSFNIDSEFDFSIVNQYKTSCNLFLFDTKSDLPGGSGVSFDWNLLIKYKLDKPFFLSGGIGIDSTEKIIDLFSKNLPIHGIDVNSKFENEDNLKDVAKLKEFKKILRL